MTIFEIIILSVALAFDAMIVSFSYGLIIKERRIEISLKLALTFGFFQFIMPVIGWFFASSVYDYVKNFSKWIVFSIFILLGLKFLIEAYTQKEETRQNCISLFCLLSLAIATSIDALGAGINIRMTNNDILLPSALIGIITIILSLTGFHIVGILCRINNKFLGIAASVILVYLAIKSII